MQERSSEAYLEAEAITKLRVFLQLHYSTNEKVLSASFKWIMEIKKYVTAFHIDVGKYVLHLPKLYDVRKKYWGLLDIPLMLQTN